MSGIDGEPIEFEWNIFPWFTLIEILRHIQESLKVRPINPDQFQGRIIFMSMFNDIGWTKNANSNVCVSNSREVNDYAKEFVLKKKKSGVERAITSQKGTGTSKPLK